MPPGPKTGAGGKSARGRDHIEATARGRPSYAPEPRPPSAATPQRREDKPARMRSTPPRRPRGEASRDDSGIRRAQRPRPGGPRPEKPSASGASRGTTTSDGRRDDDHPHRRSGPGLRVALRDLVQHPPGAVKQRSEHQPDTQRRGIDHQPPKPKIPTSPVGCPVANSPSRNSWVTKIATRQAAHTSHKPSSEAQNRGTDRYPATARPSATRKPPHTSATSSTIHGTTECRTGVSGALKLGTRRGPVGQVVAQLMHRQRSRRQQRNLRKPPNYRPTVSPQHDPEP